VKRKSAPLMAALLMVTGVGSLVPACAQLPPVTMGKTVKQPGDNQYMPQAQLDRHRDYVDRTGTNTPIFLNPAGGSAGSPRPMIQAGPVAINPMVLMYSNAPKVDISLEPIATDEPIPPAGFPPLPDRIQLPVQATNSWGGAGSGGSGGARGWSGNGGGGGGNGGGGGGGKGGGGGYEGTHQHYAHFSPGYLQNGGGGGGGGNSGGGGGGGGGYAANPDEAVPMASGGGGGGPARGSAGGQVPHHNYYKCGEVAAPSVAGGDQFNSNSRGAMGGVAPPRYTGASKKDIDKLGTAPKLDEKQDENAGAPEAPQAAVVSQSTAQDLSLPDDEFVSRQGLQDSTAKRLAKRGAQRMGNYVLQGVNQGISRAYRIIP
jgi:hypothetical protein